MTRHGGTVARSKTPTYETWRAMHGRCKPTARGHEWYYDRGICVCDRWSGPDGFANFVGDLGERPNGLTLDRIDPDRSYDPGNCRWATTAEQAFNRRRRARLSEIAELQAIIAAQQAEIVALRAR